VPYDHADKIGNHGDVAKHAVLAAIVELPLRDAQNAFVYAESHTGYAEYTLSQEGEWHDGIDVLYRAISGNCPAPLQAYHAACFGTSLRPYNLYPGSSSIVFRLVRHRAPFMFTLYEVNPAACIDLALHFPFFENVRIRREDGIQGLHSVQSASLVLVDPPDLDRRREVVQLLNTLTDNDIPFICWTPRNSGNLRENLEGNPSTEFYAMTSRHDRHRLRWQSDWRVQGTRGCQITTSVQFKEITKSVLDSLCEVMPNWIME
jgi:23S rRNA A2030 N6-methylase RlmJ